MTENLELFFRPDRNRAQRAVLEMKRRLSRSFNHIMNRAQGHVRIDPDRFQKLFWDLEGKGRIRPELFGIYTDMLAAIASDDMPLLQSLIDELAGRSFVAGDLDILAYGEAEFEPRTLKRYKRHARIEEAEVLFVTPGPEEVRRYTESLQRAFGILRRFAPECFDEVDSILSEIILIAGDPKHLDASYVGISIFELWGAIFINPAWDGESVFETAEGVVHEVAHLLLFAFGLDEPLTQNTPDKRFKSPLRVDPRPMEGIFHATFVIARMHYALSRMRNAEVMKPEEMDEALERLRDHECRFADGLSVLREHGDLTDTGRRVLQGAEDYMAGQVH